jgi:uncharacterized UBP type Zn finger protein
MADAALLMDTPNVLDPSKYASIGATEEQRIADAALLMDTSEVLDPQIAQSKRAREPAGGGERTAGFWNPGTNRCFKHVVLQMLANSQPLAELRHNIVAEELDESTAQATLALLKVIQRLWTSERPVGKEEQDTLLERFEEHLDKDFKVGQQQSPSQFFEALLRAVNPLIRDLFTFRVNRTGMCRNCSTEQPRVEAWDVVQLNFPRIGVKPVSIIDQLRNYVDSAHFSQDVLCSTCNKNTEHHAVGEGGRFQVTGAHLYLSFMPDDFKAARSNFVGGSAHISEEVVVEIVDGSKVVYDLLCLIGHKGGGLVTGHYVTHVRVGQEFLAYDREKVAKLDVHWSSVHAAACPTSST